MKSKRKSNLYEAERIPDRIRLAVLGRKLPINEISLRADISHMKLHRVMHGGVPDVETYLRIKAWLSGEAAELVARARLLTE